RCPRRCRHAPSSAPPPASPSSRPPSVLVIVMAGNPPPGRPQRGAPGGHVRFHIIYSTAPCIKSHRNPAHPERTDMDPVLDVRTMPHMMRHKTIFETYHQLAEGTAFELVNDHDPKPLYYQFDAEYAGDFTWDYLEQGPDVWRVRIGRPVDEDD